MDKISEAVHLRKTLRIIDHNEFQDRMVRIMNKFKAHSYQESIMDKLDKLDSQSGDSTIAELTAQNDKL